MSNNPPKSQKQIKPNQKPIETFKSNAQTISKAAQRGAHTATHRTTVGGSMNGGSIELGISGPALDWGGHK